MMTTSALENDILYAVCSVALAGRPVGTTPSQQIGHIPVRGTYIGTVGISNNSRRFKTTSPYEQRGYRTQPIPEALLRTL